MNEPAHAVAALLTTADNFAVVQLPGRRFPGVVFQGDSLSTFCSDAVDAQDAAVGTKAYEEIADLRRRLDEVMRSYLAALAEHGIDPPFSYRPSGE